MMGSDLTDLIFDLAPVGLMITHRQTMKQVNSTLAQFMGYRADELLEQPVAGLFRNNPEDYAQLGREAGPVLGRGDKFTGWVRCTHRDGSLRWSRAVAQSMNRPQPAEGPTLWVLEDVTAEREHSLEVQKNLEQQRTIFDNAAFGLMHVHRRRIVACNQRLGDILGYAQAELIGRRTREVFYASDEEYRRISAEGIEALKAGKTYLKQLALKRRSGEPIWIEATGHQVGAPFEPGEDVVWVIQDVTARVAAEQQLQSTLEELAESRRLAALGSLVAGVAHELNTPLGNAITAASACSELVRRLREGVAQGAMRRSELSRCIDGLEQATALIERNSQRAGDLVRDFKELAADCAAEPPVAIELGGMLLELAQARPGVKISVLAEPGLVIQSRRHVLREVLACLIENAVQHGARAGAELHLELRAVAQADQVCISVRDDGVGMTPEVLGRVFDPFFSTRFGQGRSGLGLTVARNRVVNALGGKLQASSTVGAGSCFTVALPAALPGQGGGTTDRA